MFELDQKSLSAGICLIDGFFSGYRDYNRLNFIRALRSAKDHRVNFP
jgi:hypothetical protein